MSFSKKFGLTWLFSVFILSFLAGCTTDSAFDERVGTNNTGGTTNYLNTPLTNPQPGDSGVSTNPVITATFDQALNPATLNENTVYLEDENGTKVDGVLNYQPATNTISFTPSTDLEPNGDYTFVMTPGVASVTGEALEEEYRVDFSTGDALEPLSVYVTPGDDGVTTGVAVNTMVVAEFDRKMNITTLHTPNYIYLRDENGNYVPGQIYFSANEDNNTIVTYVLDEKLANFSTYTFVVTTNVAALDGSHFMTDDLTSFTTGDTTELQVYLYPFNGQENVRVAVNPFVIFNEAMNSVTLNNLTVVLRDESNSTVLGVVEPSETATLHKATFKPTALLDKNTTYTFSVATGVTAVSGNVLTQDENSVFTTGEQDAALFAGVFSLQPDATRIDSSDSAIGTAPLIGDALDIDALSAQDMLEADVSYGALMDTLAVDENMSIAEFCDSNISVQQYYEGVIAQLRASAQNDAADAFFAVMQQMDSAQLNTPVATFQEMCKSIPSELADQNVGYFISQTGLESYTLNRTQLLGVIDDELLQKALGHGEIVEVPLNLAGITDGDSSSIRAMVVNDGTGPVIMQAGDEPLRSTQTRAQVMVQAGGDLLGDFLSLAGASTGSAVNIPIYIDLGAADSNLTVLSDDNITMAAKSGLARAFIGDINDSVFFDVNNTEITEADFNEVELLNIGLLTITIKGYAVSNGDPTALDYIPVSMYQTRSTNTPTGSSVEILVQSLLENLVLKIYVAGVEVPVTQPLIDALKGPLGDVLVPALAPVLNQLLGALGVTGESNVVLHKLIYR